MTNPEEETHLPPNVHFEILPTEESFELASELARLEIPQGKYFFFCRQARGYVCKELESIFQKEFDSIFLRDYGHEFEIFIPTDFFKQSVNHLESERI